MVDNRGHTTDIEDFKQIVNGQSRQDDVAALLGTPTSTSNFGDTTWYYITERKETVGVWAPKVADQSVTAVHFDENGVVSNIESFGKGDAKDVQVVDKYTPTEGRHLTVVEQLLGNIGRFNAPGRQMDPRNLGR